MSILVYDSGPTSNDLLESRVAENNSRALSGLIVAQIAEARAEHRNCAGRQRGDNIGA